MQVSPVHRLYTILPGEPHHEIWAVVAHIRALREDLIAAECGLTADTREWTPIQKALHQIIEEIPPLDNRLNRSYRAWKSDPVQSILAPGFRIIRCRIEAMARADAQGRSYQPFLSNIILRSSTPAPTHNGYRVSVTSPTTPPPGAFSTDYSLAEDFLGIATAQLTTQTAASFSPMSSGSGKNDGFFPFQPQPHAAYHPLMSAPQATASATIPSLHRSAPVSRATSPPPFSTSLSARADAIPSATNPLAPSSHVSNSVNSLQVHPPSIPAPTGWSAYNPWHTPRSVHHIPPPPPLHRPLENALPLTPPSDDELMEAMDVAHRLIEVIDVAVTLLTL
ncbi:hypothetical protein OF83DRAFT_1131611, partial [Amylostereum chailletii]